MATTQIPQSKPERIARWLINNTEYSIGLPLFGLSFLCLVGILAGVRVATPNTGLHTYNDYELLLYTLSAGLGGVNCILIAIFALLWSDR